MHHSFFVTEYIVGFKNYYRSQTRENFIAAALNGSSVKNWHIIKRNNPAKDYPSDFDIVFVSLFLEIMISILLM